MTASIKRRPADLFCAVGSTVTGPMPAMVVSSYRQLLPMIWPFCSATTQKHAGFEKRCEKRPMATSAEGTSLGKLCCAATWANAAKQILPQASASAGVARRMDTAGCVAVAGGGVPMCWGSLWVRVAELYHREQACKTR